MGDEQEQQYVAQIEQQHERLQSQINQLAPSLGLLDPQVARVMLITGGELVTNEAGEFQNVEELLGKLIAERPFLAAPKSLREMYAQHKRGAGLSDPRLWKK